MKILIKIVLVFAFLFITTINIKGDSAKQNDENDFTGTWLGKLKFQSMELRIVFRIEMKDGKLSALLDSPDQGANGIPVNDVKVKGDSVFLTLASIGGKFEGMFLKDSVKLSGVWKQGGGIFPLEMKKVEKVEEAKRPQEPKPPYPYNAEEVSFENKLAGIKLAGTLTFLKEGTKFPVVVMITGSGPQDRNEMVFNHKPFLIISDYLTRNGIAVLRYDDRGVGGSTGDFSKATSENFASDAVAAIEYLKTRKEIDTNKIGLIGHSEGGLIAPMVAVKNKDVSFIVLLAGTGIPGDELLPLQLKLISEAEGGKSEKIEMDLALNKKMFALIKSEPDTSIIRLKAKKLFEEYYDSLKEEDKKQIPDLNLFAEQQIKTLSSPWFKYFLYYDPRPTLEKVQCPVLALNGEKDLQVPPKENLDEIEKALKKSGNKNFKIVELPGLNHLFQTTTTGKVSEYGNNEETFSPKALEIMGNWIKEVVK